MYRGLSLAGSYIKLVSRNKQYNMLNITQVKL